MRKAVYAVIAAGLVAVIAIGLIQQSGNGDTSGSGAPTAAETQRALHGSPPALAALHEKSNDLLPGGRPRFQRELAGLKGHPVVANVWGSWCGPCRLEFPVFQSQSVRFGRRVGFLGVDSADNRGAAKKFLAKTPVSYPSVEDRGQRVAQNLGLRGLPGTAYYDEKGKLVYVHQGFYGSDDALARDIHRYLGVRPRS